MELNEIFASYNYKIILLGDRGFKSTDLFKFINNLGIKYCIRCTNDMLVKIEGKDKIKYLRDIKPIKTYIKKFNGVLLTAEKYKCNIAICKAEDSNDTWYLATNMDSKYAVLEYKKSKIIGVTKKIHNKFVRIYSLFTSGIKWFNRCYDSSIKKYKLKFDFVLYDI